MLALKQKLEQIGLRRTDIVLHMEHIFSNAIQGSAIQRELLNSTSQLHEEVQLTSCSVPQPFKLHVETPY